MFGPSPRIPKYFEVSCRLVPRMILAQSKSFENKSGGNLCGWGGQVHLHKIANPGKKRIHVSCGFPWNYMDPIHNSSRDLWAYDSPCSPFYANQNYYVNGFLDCWRISAYDGLGSSLLGFAEPLDECFLLMCNAQRTHFPAMDKLANKARIVSIRAIPL